jgi:diacylglycerol kinase (ATP)
MKPSPNQYRPLRAKLIYNPSSGASGASPGQLLDVLTELQAWNLVPEVYLVEQGRELLPVVHDALHRGIRLFVVCGGDGTVDSVAAGLVGTPATLGIIPSGTQNNVALNLGIPGDIPAAAALLRTGRRINLDVGLAVCGEIERPFLEACSVGLLSALFPTADAIQHGNLARIGDFLATLITSPAAELHLVLDTQREITTQGHVVLTANMPYIGPRYPIARDVSFTDGLLDVLVFAELSKLELLRNAAQLAGGGPEDPRIQRYQVRSVEIATTPPMPVNADGFALGVAPVRISVRRRALAVMVGRQVSGGSGRRRRLPSSQSLS